MVRLLLSSGIRLRSSHFLVFTDAFGVDCGGSLGCDYDCDKSLSKVFTFVFMFVSVSACIKRPDVLASFVSFCIALDGSCFIYCQPVDQCSPRP